MDKQPRQIIAFHVGDCSHERAQQLWANLPAVYREQATFYTDQYAGLYRDHSGGTTQSHHEARPENQSYRAVQ